MITTQTVVFAWQRYGYTTITFQNIYKAEVWFRKAGLFKKDFARGPGWIAICIKLNWLRVAGVIT